MIEKSYRRVVIPDHVAGNSTSNVHLEVIIVVHLSLGQSRTPICDNFLFDYGVKLNELFY